MRAHPFKDYRPAASWRTTCLRPPQPPPSEHPLFSVKGVGLFTLALDAMHVLDLGVLQHAIANALFVLVHDAEGAQWGQGAPQRMAAIWVRIQELYRERGTATRLTNLDLGFISTSGGVTTHFPQLRAKAAETRCLLPIVASILHETRCDLIQQDAPLGDFVPMRVMRQCLDAFVLVKDLIDAACPVPGQAVGRQIMAAMETALFSYHTLAAIEFYKERLRWNVVPKHHFAHHLAERSAACSPKLLWTYGYEDLVGRAQRAAHACANANARIALGNAFMAKYRLILAAALPQGAPRLVPARGRKRQRL